jgi:hypothetical protein
VNEKRTKPHHHDGTGIARIRDYNYSTLCITDAKVPRVLNHSCHAMCILNIKDQHDWYKCLGEDFVSARLQVI